MTVFATLALSLGASFVFAETCDASNFRVAIDVGHTRAQPGATSARGVPEFNFNLRLAGVVMGTLIEAGFSQTLMIGASGAEIALQERAERANRVDADLFISVHHDSVQPQYLSTWEYEGVKRRYSDMFDGYSLFVSGENPRFADSVVFAEYLADQLMSARFTPTLHHAEPIKGESRDLIDSTRGIYRWDGLAVTRRTLMPAVLFEAGVIVNRAEEERLSKPEIQQQIANSIVQAVTAFCGRMIEDE